MPTKALQFGGGNFLRAFIPGHLDLDITVVKPTPRGDYAELRAQDGRYQVVTRGVLNGATVDRVDVIDRVKAVVHPYNDWAGFLATAEDAEMNIVISNTTEAGIRFTPEAWAKDSCPTEFPAKLCRWLHRRFEHFNGSAESGVVLLPCELIEGNGDRLLEAVLAYAAHWKLSAGFQTWLKDNTVVANTLVDRIVSGYPENAAELRPRLGFDDALLTVAEPYSIFVMEGPAELKKRLPLQTSHNVVFTDDLDRYRTLKVRILNGMHILMVAVGIPAGVETVADFVDDAKWGPWLEAALYEEIIPSLPYEETESKAYAGEIFDRFRNPFLFHKLSSIALNKDSKFAVRVAPSIEAYAAKFGKPPVKLSEAAAAMKG